MISSKAVKTTALQTLRGHWVWSAAVIGVVLLCVAVGYYCTVIFLSLLGTFAFLPAFLILVGLVFPAVLGALRCFWRLAGGVEESPCAVLFYFSSRSAYWRAFLFSLYFCGLLLLIGMAFLLPGFLLNLLAKGVLFSSLAGRFPVLLAVVRILSYALIAVGIWLWFVQGSVLYLAPFLLVTVESDSPFACLERAKAIGVYTKSQYLSHFWSFIGWIVLSFLLVPLLFTAPYLLMCYAVECRFNVAYYNRVGSCGTGERPIYRV